jgi:membrane-bound serine protease (ClpP class)
LSSLLTHLTNPDIAVFLLVAGIFLIYLEFNVPGTVIPGALGTLFAMLAVYGLIQLPLNPFAFLILAVGFILLLSHLLIQRLMPILRFGPIAAGTIAIIFGLTKLVASPDPAVRVHSLTAIIAGTLFSGVTLALAWIALLARRNKAIRPRAPH